MTSAVEDATLVLTNKTSKVLSMESFVSFRDPWSLGQDHWFALMLEVTSAFVLGLIITHAKRKGNRDLYLVLCAMISVIIFEILPLLPRPGYQLWWYHQGAVNLLKQRLPSYVFTSFACVSYAAHLATSASRLPPLCRSVASAACATFLYFPCLWLAPKLLLVFTHHDDQVFRDTVLGVPAIQVVVVFLLFLHTSQVYLENIAEEPPRGALNSVWCSFHSGLVAALYALTEQYLLYILVRLIVKVHTGFCLVVAAGVLVFLVQKEFHPLEFVSCHFSGAGKPLMRPVLWYSAAALMLVSLVPYAVDTSLLRSTSTRLELGPCNITHEVSNTSPLEIPRRRFVCPDDVTDNFVPFDFHCMDDNSVQKGVLSNAPLYTVCGRPIEQPLRLTTMLLIYSAGCVVGLHTLMRVVCRFKNEPHLVEKK